MAEGSFNLEPVPSAYVIQPVGSDGWLRGEHRYGRYFHPSGKGHDLGKGLGRDGLIGIALELFAIPFGLNDLDEKPVHAGGQGGSGHRGHQGPGAGSVGRVADHR